MTPTSADPGAIDLDAIKAKFPLPMDIPTEVGLDLIAAVEALRERVGKLEQCIKDDSALYITSTDKLRACAEAAEARVAELAGALEWVLDILDVNDKFIFEELGAECDKRLNQAAKTKARAVLAATPAEALERAKVKDEAYEKMVQFLDDWAAQFVCWGMLTDDEANSAVQNFVVWAHDITATAPATQEALAKLDNLGKKEN